MSDSEIENQDQLGDAQAPDEATSTRNRGVSPCGFADGDERNNTTATFDPFPMSDMILDRSSRRRRHSSCEKDSDKKPKKKTREKKKEKKSSYFAIDDDCSTIQATNCGAGSQDDYEYANDKEKHRQRQLLRAPSLEFLPPPSGFSLSDDPTNEDTEASRKGIDSVAPTSAADTGSRSRPGAMHFRTREYFSASTRRFFGPRTTTEPSDEDGIFVTSPSENVSGRDIMAQAELVQPTIVAAANVGPDPLTDELQRRVGMLEEDKAARDGHNCPIKLRQGSLRCLFVLLLLIVGVAIAAVAFLIGRRSVIVPTESPAPVSIHLPSSSPSLFPTSFPSLSPTLLPTVDFEQLWLSLIHSKSPAANFDNASSPERQALDWMLQDSFTMSVFDNESRVLQRFALSVFFFATGGTLRGWLENSTECSWGGIGATLGCGVSDNIEYMDMDEVDVRGSIPKEIGLLTDLSLWSLGKSKFEGSIPTEIGKLSKLTKVDLRFMRSLTGTIPTEIGWLSALTQLGIYGCHKVEGTIPTEIGLLSTCDFFSIYGLSLNGTIPSEVGLMTSLTLLDFSENKNLSGTLPAELAELTGMDQLHLYDTDLSGSIPSSLCGLQRELSIDCDKINCTCCVGPHPGLCPCEALTAVPGTL